MQLLGFPAVDPGTSGAGAPHHMSEENRTVGIGNHGASRLPSVEVDSYNIELKD